MPNIAQLSLYILTAVTSLVLIVRSSISVQRFYDTFSKASSELWGEQICFPMATGLRIYQQKHSLGLTQLKPRCSFEVLLAGRTLSTLRSS